MNFDVHLTFRWVKSCESSIAFREESTAFEGGASRRLSEWFAIHGNSSDVNPSQTEGKIGDAYRQIKLDSISLHTGYIIEFWATVESNKVKLKRSNLSCFIPDFYQCKDVYTE